MKQKFHFNLDVAKAEEREGRAYITVYATDSAPDKVGEACSEECLHSLAEQFKSGKVELLNTHQDAIGFGKVVNGWVVDAEQFHPDLAGQGVKAVLAEVELDLEFPHARRLFERAQDPEERKRLGFSIYGRLDRSNPRFLVWRNGRKVFNALSCDHITVTRFNREANGRTHIADAVMKSLDWSDDDVAVVQKEQAPYTVADLAKQYGLPIGEDVVAKSLREAHFSGSTAESGRDKHVHEFVARLDGTSGTLRGYTMPPTAGDRHFHVIDLMDAEAMQTAGASRGADHKHALGIGSIRQITQDAFSKVVTELNAADSRLTTEGEPVKDQDTPTAPAAAAQPPSGAPAPAVSPKPETPTPAQAEFHKELGWLHSFREALGSMFGKPTNAHEVIESLADTLTPDYAANGGDVESLAKAVIALNQRVAGIRVERDSLTVRTAKLFDVFDSAGMLKRLSAPVFDTDEAKALAEAAHIVPADVSAGEGVEDEPETPETAAVEGAEGDGAEGVDAGGEEQQAASAAGGEEPEMTEEQMAQMEERIAAKVSTGLLDTFRKAGLLPAEGDEQPEAAAAVTDPAGAEATGDEPEAGAGEGDEAQDEDEGEPLSKILTTLDDVVKSVGGLSERLAKIEGAPAGRRSQEGHDAGAAAGKTGVFTGVFSPRQA